MRVKLSYGFTHREREALKHHLSLDHLPSHEELRAATLRAIWDHFGSLRKRLDDHEQDEARRKELANRQPTLPAII